MNLLILLYIKDFVRKRYVQLRKRKTRVNKKWFQYISIEEKKRKKKKQDLGVVVLCAAFNQAK